MSILERALYDKFFNNSSYDIATMYLEEAFQYATDLARNTGEKRYVILYVLLHLDYIHYNHKIFTMIYKDDISNIANKINAGISFDEYDDFMNKFNNWTKREHYKKYPTHMFGDLIL